YDLRNTFNQLDRWSGLINQALRPTGLPFQQAATIFDPVELLSNASSGDLKLSFQFNEPAAAQAHLLAPTLLELTIPRVLPNEFSARLFSEEGQLNDSGHDVGFGTAPGTDEPAFIVEGKLPVSAEPVFSLMRFISDSLYI